VTVVPPLAIGKTQVPLLTTEQKWIFDNNHSAIGFWMTIEGAVPIEPIRVFVTCEALAQLDPSQPRDTVAAGKIFEKYRARIADAASEKFDSKDIEDERHEGQRVVKVDATNLGL
jgi:hypothetical protein